jgi:sigma-B regulation protein RsbU (phosphoserine phosphatase)
MLRARTYVWTLAQETVARELAVAARIQEGLLPSESPYLPGWQLAASLTPARETSGDFYDFISLPGERLGIVVADVADKGAGAALYMAMSRTLIRTYAVEFRGQPEQALAATNARILADTDLTLFATVFYGVLDPTSGALVYCNAGHNPPYLLGGPERDQVQALTRTGMALGVLEEATWEQGMAQLAPGDALLLYTDGVTEAHSPEQGMFGEERLLRRATACGRCTARDVHEALLADVHRFVGDAPQSDDLTLMVLARS